MTDNALTIMQNVDKVKYFCSRWHCNKRIKAIKDIYDNEYQQFLTAALLFWTSAQRICSPLLDNAVLMRQTALLWSILDNHLATSYPCHGRGLLSPAVPHQQRISHLMCLPALSFTQHYHFRSYFIITFQLKTCLLNLFDAQIKHQIKFYSSHNNHLHVTG